MNRYAVSILMALLTGAAAQTVPPPQRDRTGSTAPAPKTVIPRQGCVTAECHPGIKNRPFLHGPIRVNGCDGCHKPTDETKHTFEPVRERHELCGLCHAPEPSTSPFVHEPFARGECLACHDPHGSTESRLLRGDRYVDSCLKCHADVTGAHDSVHGPASVGACGACHQPHASERPKLLNAEGRDLCLKCHLRTSVEVETSLFVHEPVKGDCGVCHNPHATDQRAMLVADPATLCVQCHADIEHTMSTATTQHAAVTTKRACLNCHTPHASKNASLLKDDVKTLCFECHNQPIRLQDGTTIANMKSVVESGTSLHGTATQRGCVECHQIHGGDHRRLLVNEYPSDIYFPFSESSYSLCFSCHDRQLVMLASTDSATGFRNGETNLHYVHVNKDRKGRSCKICHDAHAATRGKNIRDEVQFGPGGWKLPINYEPMPQGGRCGAGCHAPLEYNRVTPVLYPQPKAGNWKGEDLIPGSHVEQPDMPKKK